MSYIAIYCIVCTTFVVNKRIQYSYMRCFPVRRTPSRV